MKKGKLLGGVLLTVLILATSVGVAVQAASTGAKPVAVTTSAVAVDIQAGWNLIGVPREIDLATSNVASKLKESGGYKASYYWPADNAYYGANYLYPGWGYWVEASEAFKWDFSEPKVDVTFEVAKGWNLVSVPREVSIEELEKQVSLKSAGDYHAWYFWLADNAYYGSNTLYPGWGYWIETEEKGVVKISVSTSPAPTATAAPARRAAP